MCKSHKIYVRNDLESRRMLLSNVKAFEVSENFSIGHDYIWNETDAIYVLYFVDRFSKITV